MSNNLNGLPARYYVTPPTLSDGDATALRVDENAALVVTLDGSVAVPEPPSTGTFVLTSTDGVLSWETP